MTLWKWKWDFFKADICQSKKGTMMEAVLDGISNWCIGAKSLSFETRRGKAGWSLKKSLEQQPVVKTRVRNKVIRVFLEHHWRLRGKEPPCNAGDTDLNTGLERSPGGGNGNPLQHSCLEKPHGQRSLVGYSPKCHEESVTTEWLNTHTHTHTHTGVSSQWSWQQLWALQLRTEPVVLFSRADILYIINDQVWTYEMRSMK